ncbi:hypothetical protein ACLB2K_034971 [Fragaria x ananassa]
MGAVTAEVMKCLKQAFDDIHWRKIPKNLIHRINDLSEFVIVDPVGKEIARSTCFRVGLRKRTEISKRAGCN